jgi:ABC-2 type transport system ATP-binding protein
MQVNVKNLKRHFDTTKAVDDVSFTFGQGQVVGFVGPNGAGKTTTMRIMATMDDPTEGDIYFDDVSVVQYPEKARKMVGFMPDLLPTHRDVTVDDYLDFFARAFGIRCSRRNAVVQGIEEFTNLTGIKDKFLNTLSKGMKQRVSLARALIHDPSILILDEPAAGLDPRARIELRELLLALSIQGKAILISSHILSELAEICNSAIIIEKGKILKAGRLDALSAEKPHFTVMVRAAGDQHQLYKKLVMLPNIIDARIVGDGIEIDIEGPHENSTKIIRSLINDNVPLVEFSQIKAGLEDIFMTITKGELN